MIQSKLLFLRVGSKCGTTWENRHCFINTFDHGIQYDVDSVMEKGALVAADINTDTEEFYNDPILPDGVISSYHNTIRPSTLSSKRSGRYSDNTKMQAVPLKLHVSEGIIEILSTDNADSVSVLSAPVVPVVQPRKKRPDNQPNSRSIIPKSPFPRLKVTTLPDDDKDDWEDSQNKMGCSDPYCPVVLTQDLLNTQDFG
jgi:hypothetical protein